MTFEIWGAANQALFLGLGWLGYNPKAGMRSPLVAITLSYFID